MVGSLLSAARGRSAVRLSRAGVCRADVVEEWKTERARGLPKLSRSVRL